MKNDIETIIFDDLIKSINKGKYKPGDKLPSENELYCTYNIPRINIKKVYKLLEDMGYIYSKHGKGRYIKNRYEKIELVLLGEESFSKKMKEKGYNLVTKNIAFKKIDYDEGIYKKLDANKDEEVYKIARLRIIDERPVAIHTSYVSKRMFDDIDIVGENIISMFQYYYEKGFNSFKSSISLLSVSIPTLKEIEILKCSNLIPLLVLETDCIDKKSDNVLEYTKIIYRGDCFKYNLLD